MILQANLQFIYWTTSPEIISFGAFAVRWYGLLFALGFLIGQNILTKFYRIEGKNEADVEKITLYMVAATVIGARLGHCLFYQPDYYLANPIEIFKVWEGGLASHGATIGILTGIWLYSRKHADQSFLWLLDRIVITACLAGCFIRLGNLMNSEIVGTPTTLPWGFIFANNGENFARHPAQLYEALFCLALFFFLYHVYMKTKAATPKGKITGLFFILLFGFRFLIEFVKSEQVDFEKGMLLNMGQILSMPAILFGVWVYFNSVKKTAN
jgi:prolipoprotein diacylglyceryl transferase